MTLYEKYLARAEQAFAERAERDPVAAESLRQFNAALDRLYVNRCPQDAGRVFRMLVQAGQVQR
jgi:hypothetical protein